jgi:hypothetical protein
MFWYDWNQIQTLSNSPPERRLENIFGFETKQPK